jgi:hypothetical protein
MELSPGLHRIECPIGPRYVAIYAIVGSKYTLLVDTGFDDSIRTTVVNYFKEKKRAGIINLKNGVLYIVPKCQEFQGLFNILLDFQLLKDNEILGIFLILRK